MAYADWAALYPMSQLEFEKVCRGSAQPLTGEYAWGITLYEMATGVSNPGLIYETPTQIGANIDASPGSYYLGLMRAGGFAQMLNTRLQSGVGHYRIMELSGNLWEHCYPKSNSTLRGFDGSHGDGYLVPFATHIGDLTNTGWRNRHVHIHAGGFRGGSFAYAIPQARVSDRYLAFYGGTDRMVEGGFHCVRAAP
ncbi:MAG: hypothetical protein JXA28_14065 [Bacteroidetes bacterium]|nr:hypothetical protein [Bacteroidota bacterium]